MLYLAVLQACDSVTPNDGDLCFVKFLIFSLLTGCLGIFGLLIVDMIS